MLFRVASSSLAISPRLSGSGSRPLRLAGTRREKSPCPKTWRYKKRIPASFWLQVLKATFRSVIK